MMVLDNKFEIGQIVFLKTDIDQLGRVVTQIMVSARGIMYDLCIGERVSCHHELEINAEVNELIKVK